jgi:hypothetical protein
VLWLPHYYEYTTYRLHHDVGAPERKNRSHALVSPTTPLPRQKLQPHVINCLVVGPQGRWALCFCPSGYLISHQNNKLHRCACPSQNETHSSLQPELFFSLLTDRALTFLKTKTSYAGNACRPTFRPTHATLLSLSSQQLSRIQHRLARDCTREK